MTWYRNRTDFDNSDPETAADHNQMSGYIRYHRADHEASGNQPLKLDDLYAPDDTTDLDGTNSVHGLFPKTRYATFFLSGNGGYGTVRLSAASSATIDTSTNYNAYAGVKFTAATTDTSWNFSFIMPGNTASQTTFLVRPYWTSQNTTATSQTMILGFKALCTDPDTSANIGKTLGTESRVTYTVAKETSNNLIRSAITTVTPALSIGQTAIGPYDLVNFRVSRKGYDTFAGDIILLGIMVRYQVDGPNDWV